jgi:hypothetical protein
MDVEVIVLGCRVDVKQLRQSTQPPDGQGLLREVSVTSEDDGTRTRNHRIDRRFDYPSAFDSETQTSPEFSQVGELLKVRNSGLEATGFVRHNGISSVTRLDPAFEAIVPILVREWRAKHPVTSRP